MSEPAALVQARDILLQGLKPHRDVVVGGKLADLREDAEGIEQVDDEDTEKDTEEEGQHDVIEEPIHDVVEHGVDDVAIEGTERRPVERKFGTDDALDIPPLLAVIPQLDVHPHDEDLPRDILDQGHGDPHQQDAHHHARHSGQPRKIDRCQPVQSPQPKAVKRQARTDQKARVDPFFRRAEAAVEQFKQPPERSTQPKQQYQCQKASDNAHIPSPAPRRAVSKFPSMHLLYRIFPLLSIFF